MMDKNITMKIAIDGPGGAGKSTLAKALAKKLGFAYVDTGAIYRTVGYAARSKGIAPDDAAAVSAMLKDIKVEAKFEDGRQDMYLDGEFLGDRIREHEISNYASAVSAIPAVREYLFDMQRSIADANNVIMDGRDIGTVILPDAQLKVFLTATAEERALRRTNELIEKGQKADYEQVLADIKERDDRDSSRAIAPLKPADDAILFNNTGFTPAQSLERLLEIVADRLGIVEVRDEK
jgi:cytidylate kinase